MHKVECRQFFLNFKETLPEEEQKPFSLDGLTEWGGRE
jgi:hypothetical protein